MAVKNGANTFQNQRALMSLFPGVRDDIELIPFYTALSKRLAQQTLTADEFIGVWNEAVLEFFDGTDLFEWAVENFPQYTKQLIAYNNPMFAQIIISRYFNDDEKIISKGSPVPVVEATEVIDVEEVVVASHAWEHSGVDVAGDEVKVLEITVGVDVGVDGGDTTVITSVPVETVVADDTALEIPEGVSISQADYAKMTTAIRSLDKIVDLRAYAAGLDIVVSGTSKQGIREQIIGELGNRVE